MFLFEIIQSNIDITYIPQKKGKAYIQMIGCG